MARVTPLKIAIVASGMKTCELAERSGVSLRTISRLSRVNEHNPAQPSHTTQHALARALNKPVTELWPAPTEQKAAA